jgi:hypothetical protein
MVAWMHKTLSYALNFCAAVSQKLHMMKKVLDYMSLAFYFTLRVLG